VTAATLCVPRLTHAHLLTPFSCGKAALAAVIHERSTAPELGTLLATLSAADLAAAGLDDYARANVREAAREHRKAATVSEDLVRREAELESSGYSSWVKARAAKDFSAFAPSLEAWVSARRERAAAVDPSKPAYDVLLDNYSAGLTKTRVAEIFAAVKAELVPLLAELRAAGAAAPDASWLAGAYALDAQAALCRELAVALGFDLDKGRLDVSIHPFTGGAHPTDVRMTTRFKESDVMEGITGAVHETGHAL
jgi:carboxypeptidase Taq